MRSLILVIFLLSSCAQAEIEQAREFGKYLRCLILNNDRDTFFKLPCFPSDCVDRDDIDYIFGVDEEFGFIHSFLKRSGVKMKVFGPFSYNDSSGGNDFILMYFDPELVKFNDEGNLSESDRQELWWKGYIETVVHCQEDICGFQKTPFYHGAHLPWVEDY